jgi:hypothetical protein
MACCESSSVSRARGRGWQQTLATLVALAGMALGACNSVSSTPPSQASGSAPVQPAPQLAPPQQAPAAKQTSGWTKLEEQDRGPLCLSRERPSDPRLYVNRAWGQRAALQVEEGDALYLVFRGVCLNSCERNGQVACTVERAGSRLVARLAASFEQTNKGPCTDHSQCEPTVCRLPALEAGSYTLQYGPDSRELKVPGELKPACMPGATAPAQ